MNKIKGTAFIKLKLTSEIPVIIEAVKALAAFIHSFHNIDVYGYFLNCHFLHLQMSEVYVNKPQ